ncbi:MAG TPA: TraR/DksA C4-type zinc finger protein [Spirochaetota bacterium]|mgnify:CR=1 FL=1|nr:TraR/DksA C4-type zinc finger protein [Spirochaetota bacterium]
MTKEQLEHYKELLLKEKDEILKELMESNDSSKNLLENESNNVNDSVDEATTNITQNILNIVSSKNQQTLLAIDAAMRRITEGSFGKCITCGCDISSNRLEALPWATKCIECKNKDEKRK